jgi:hypothetical protein
MAIFPITHIRGGAHGVFDDVTRKIEIHVGSILTIQPFQTAPANIASNYRAVQEHILAGDIVALPNGTYQVANTLTGLSPSAARVFVDGNAGSGWMAWHLANGALIDTLRLNVPPAPAVPVPVPPIVAAPIVAQALRRGRRRGAVVAGNGALDCLSLTHFPALPPYLWERRATIRNLGRHTLPRWGSSYKGFRQGVMVRLGKKFQNRTITREQLIKMFTLWKDPVLCLIAAMVWGSIKPKHLRSLLRMGEKPLLRKMNALRLLVRSGELEQAFDACQAGGPLKLRGVGLSFFTKLFFFIGQEPPVLQPIPLIFDKWTTHAFCVLGAQVCVSPRWKEIFNLKPLYKPKPDAVLLKRSTDSRIYRIYVAWMNHWATLLGTSPGKLEQFVFGVSRKTRAGKAASNPRNELIELGRQLFPSS